MDRYCFIGADILVAGDLSSPRCPSEPWLGIEAEALFRRQYESQGASCEAVEARVPEAAPETWVPAGLARIPIRQAIASFPEPEVRAFLKGRALLNWLQGALRCGECGAVLSDAAGSDAQGRICPSCGRLHFPRISPAVIVLVRKEGKALLARNARFPPGRYGLIAGFVEAGETLEECAARESREEAGIEIRELRYRRSQPWPFPDSLMLAFTAEWDGGEARPDGAEIAELLWCGPGELPPGIPPPGSVARYLIDEFVRECLEGL